METLFTAKAQAFKAEGRFKNAEKALLAIRRWDAAVQMYQQAAMYSDYLRLIKHSPEQLPAALAWVGQQREQEGNYKCAFPLPFCHQIFRHQPDPECFLVIRMPQIIPVHRLRSIRYCTMCNLP
jgi:hypothetical protein